MENGLRDNLTDIAEIGTLITSTFDVDRILAVFMERVLELLGAEVGSVMLLENGELATRIEWGLEDAAARRIRFKSGNPLCEEALRRKEVLTMSNLADDPEIELPEGNFYVNSYLGLPLIWRNQIIGVANVINMSGNGDVVESRRESLSALCSFAVVAIENARLHKEMIEKEILDREIELAAQIQRALLPERKLELPGFELESYYSPAKHIGGDYFDAVLLEDGRLALAIGDVAGHGISTALLMSGFRSAVRSFIKNAPDPCSVVISANAELCRDSTRWGNTFISFCYVLLDPDSGEGIYSNAGHSQPIIISEGKPVLELTDDSGLVLGIVEDSEYNEYPFRMKKDDLLMLYTDGVTEHRNLDGDMFGKDRLKSILQDLEGNNATEIVGKLLEELEAWNELKMKEDDVTFLLLKMQGG